ncbi:MAG: hypothetical protein H0X40_07240 [Chthoniobacterales bacterium]|nr:hypothetical protein [Chthoniobacterales bacterium]
MPPLLLGQDDGAANAPDLIFSNLETTPGERFNSNQFAGFAVAGISAIGVTESGAAILFVPKADTRAKVLSAAISYLSGAKLVNLGIYSNNEVTGSVGTLLPGGQGSTTKIPDAGECCQLAKVVLPGEGALLNKGTLYWLVATADDVNGPDFSGSWSLSNLPKSANYSPSFLWQTYPGQWAAAQIAGTNVQTQHLEKAGRLGEAWSSAEAPNNKVTIFANLGSSSVGRYDFRGGFPIKGKSANPPGPEEWQAQTFTVAANAHATVLAAAIAYVSGTKKINLGIYSDSDGNVGTPLPDGQGSAVDIPASGMCCALTEVKLPGSGVALTKGTQYWLVASTDGVNAPDFNGLWHSSLAAVSAYEQPENFINWSSLDGDWLGARIQGTTP